MESNTILNAVSDQNREKSERGGLGPQTQAGTIPAEPEEAAARSGANTVVFPPAPAPRPPAKHRTDIDGLRAIAVLAVVGFHCGIPWLGGGFVGVDIFFVISGYLICSLVYKEVQRGSFSIAKFYERRFKRIIPALAVVLLFTLSLGALVLTPFEAHRLGDSAIATALSASNFLFIVRSGYFAVNAARNPLLMTWSLGVEEQFYIVFPLLLLFLARNRTRRSLFLWLAILTTLSLLACIYAEFRLPSANFYLPVTRAWELGAGVLLAIRQGGSLGTGRRPSWKADATCAIGFALILVPIMLYRSTTRFPGYEAIPPVLGSLLLLAYGSSRVGRILTWRPLVAIGLISYSFYLWHWPLLSYARILNGKSPEPRTLALLMAIAFGAAILSYFFIETPFRSWRTARTSTALWSYGAVLMLLVAAGAAFSLTRGLPMRSPGLAKIETEAQLDRHYPCISQSSGLKLSQECVPPPGAGKPTLALLGDSHAEVLWNALNGVARNEGWQVVALTHVSCPPLQGVTQWNANIPGNPESCSKFNQAALRYVLSRPDIREVLLVGYWGLGTVLPDSSHAVPQNQSPEDHAALIGQGLAREVADLERAGKTVIVMKDVPNFPYDPVIAVQYRFLPFRRYLNRLFLSKPPDSGYGDSDSRSTSQTAADVVSSQEIDRLRSGDPRIRVVDPRDILCHGERCYFQGPAGLYYVDPDHLSYIGAMQVVAVIPRPQ